MEPLDACLFIVPPEHRRPVPIRADQAACAGEDRSLWHRMARRWTAPDSVTACPRCGSVAA